MSYKFPENAYKLSPNTITYRDLSRRISTEATRLNGHLINHPILIQNPNSHIALPDKASRPNTLELYTTKDPSVYYAVLQANERVFAAKVVDTGIEPKLDWYGNPEKGSKPRYRIEPLGTLEAIANTAHAKAKEKV